MLLEYLLLHGLVDVVVARVHRERAGRPEAQPRLLAYSRGEAGGLIGRQLEEAQIQEMMAARPGY